MREGPFLLTMLQDQRSGLSNSSLFHFQLYYGFFERVKPLALWAVVLHGWSPEPTNLLSLQIMFIGYNLGETLALCPFHL